MSRSNVEIQLQNLSNRYGVEKTRRKNQKLTVKSSLTPKEFLKKKKKREVRSKIMRKRLEKESSEYISNGMIETLNSPSTNTDVDNADMFAEKSELVKMMMNESEQVDWESVNLRMVMSLSKPPKKKKKSK